MNEERIGIIRHQAKEHPSKAFFSEDVMFLLSELEQLQARYNTLLLDHAYEKTLLEVRLDKSQQLNDAYRRREDEG